MSDTSPTLPSLLGDLDELVRRLEQLRDAEHAAIEQALKIDAATDDNGVATGRWEIAIYSESRFVMSLITTGDSEYEGADDLLVRTEELRDLVAAAAEPGAA